MPRGFAAKAVPAKSDVDPILQSTQKEIDAIFAQLETLETMISAPIGQDGRDLKGEADTSALGAILASLKTLKVLVVARWKAIGNPEIKRTAAHVAEKDITKARKDIAALRATLETLSEHVRQCIVPFNIPLPESAKKNAA